MNPYIKEDYYFDVFNGSMLSDDDVEKYLLIAQEKIDDITFNRIVHIGFDNLTDFQKDCVSKAICYQAEYYFENGINSMSGVSSYSVLDISVNVDKTHESEAQKKGMSDFAYMSIKKSGLTSGLL